MADSETYPGTVTPLRGLLPFAESDRDVFFGRDRERDELVRLVTGEGFRAGLLYGEPGVGKTSLLRAGLVPHLRDHGVVALLCDDLNHPADALADALARAMGLHPAENEPSIAFLARTVGQALSGQLHLFILDEVDTVLGGGEERVVSELGELFARVVTRSSGRARFLFACASERMHLFGALERRTGSLFPPSSRYELTRFSGAQATAVLERTLVLAGASDNPDLGRAIVDTLARSGPILPADIQIAAHAVRELNLRHPAALEPLGGAAELERLWLTAAAAATGDERAALRFLAELCHGRGRSPEALSAAASRASVDLGFAERAVTVLAGRGVVQLVPIGPASEPHAVLSHEVLAPRIREVAAPARAAARRAFELLGSRRKHHGRLAAREWLAIYREGIAPSTPEERAVLEQTKKFALIVGSTVAAAPLLVLVVIYISLLGRFYLDTAPPGNAGEERLVVRAGRPALSWFHWLPHSPGFGEIIADTGLGPGMVQPAAWERIAEGAGSAALDADGGYAAAALATLRPGLRSLLTYASDGSESALEGLRKDLRSPDELVELLEALRPIARGTPREVALIEEALEDVSPAVQRAAIAVAVAGSQRRPGAYDALLARTLAASTAELRRLGVSEVRRLGAARAAELFRTALALDPPAEVRRELASQVAAAGSEVELSASAAAALLARGNLPGDAGARARAALTRAFAGRPEEATRAAAGLASNAKAGDDVRVFALRQLAELAPPEQLAAIAGDVDAALEARAESVRAAALPLHARIAPDTAAGNLAVMLGQPELSQELRVAVALAWGAAAQRQQRAASSALQQLLTDRAAPVRAAAARAYGSLGRAAIEPLIKMIKRERLDVAAGAAFGLAESVRAGAPAGSAISGIAQLWKRKGRARHTAAEAFARLARHAPAAVQGYLAQGIAAKEDTEVRHQSAAGLCHAVAAGHRGARRLLPRAAEDPSLDVRRLVSQCAVDHHRSAPDLALDIAAAVVDDSDVGVREQAARLLLELAVAGKLPERQAGLLLRLAGDGEQKVRILAERGLASARGLDTAELAGVLARAFAVADEAEKLTVLATAREKRLAALVPLAASDEAPSVRVAALETAIGIGTDVGSTFLAALTDPDASVRRAALERLHKGGPGLDADATRRALALAVHDPDPAIRAVALTTMARVAPEADVLARLSLLLSARSENERAAAAAAARGLVARDARGVVTLLSPHLSDPSHDVRRALLPSLAAAYAATRSPRELAEMLGASERDPAGRLVAAAAFALIARSESGMQAARTELDNIAQGGPPLARHTARLTLGLLSAGGDAVSFLTLLMP